MSGWRSWFGLGPADGNGGAATGKDSARQHQQQGHAQSAARPVVASQQDGAFTASGDDRFTLRYLQALYNVLMREKGASPSAASDAALIDAIKQISELMVWGDKHNERFFEFFGEKGVMRAMLEVFRTRSSYVKVQIIQTVSIILMNIANNRSLFYLLSNNHVNELVAAGSASLLRNSPHVYLGFETKSAMASAAAGPGSSSMGGNATLPAPEQSPTSSAGEEELLAFWISFLKTLSLSATAQTIQFFFTAGNASLNSAGMPPTLHLYTEALRYFGHPDSMVRTSVRTITLKIFEIRDPAVRRFLVSGPHASYPQLLVKNLADTVRRASNLLTAVAHATVGRIGTAEAVAAEHAADEWRRRNAATTAQRKAGKNGRRRKSSAAGVPLPLPPATEQPPFLSSFSAAAVAPASPSVISPANVFSLIPITADIVGHPWAPYAASSATSNSSSSSSTSKSSETEGDGTGAANAQLGPRRSLVAAATGSTPSAGIAPPPVPSAQGGASLSSSASVVSASALSVNTATAAQGVVAAAATRYGKGTKARSRQNSGSPLGPLFHPPLSPGSSLAGGEDGAGGDDAGAFPFGSSSSFPDLTAFSPPTYPDANDESQQGTSHYPTVDSAVAMLTAAVLSKGRTLNIASLPGFYLGAASAATAAAPSASSASAGQFLPPPAPPAMSGVQVGATETPKGGLMARPSFFASSSVSTSPSASSVPPSSSAHQTAPSSWWEGRPVLGIASVVSSGSSSSSVAVSSATGLSATLRPLPATRQVVADLCKRAMVSVNDCLAEIADTLYYLQDVLAIEQRERLQDERAQAAFEQKMKEREEMKGKRKKEQEEHEAAMAAAAQQADSTSSTTAATGASEEGTPQASPAAEDAVISETPSAASASATAEVAGPVDAAPVAKRRRGSLEDDEGHSSFSPFVALLLRALDTAIVQPCILQPLVNSTVAALRRRMQAQKVITKGSGLAAGTTAAAPSAPESEVLPKRLTELPLSAVAHLPPLTSSSSVVDPSLALRLAAMLLKIVPHDAARVLTVRALTTSLDGFVGPSDLSAAAECLAAAAKDETQRAAQQASLAPVDLVFLLSASPDQRISSSAALLGLELLHLGCSYLDAPAMPEALDQSAPLERDDGEEGDDYGGGGGSSRTSQRSFAEPSSPAAAAGGAGRIRVHTAAKLDNEALAKKAAMGRYSAAVDAAGNAAAEHYKNQGRLQPFALICERLASHGLLPWWQWPAVARLSKAAGRTSNDEEEMSSQHCSRLADSLRRNLLVLCESAFLRLPLPRPSTSKLLQALLLRLYMPPASVTSKSSPGLLAFFASMSQGDSEGVPPSSAPAITHFLPRFLRGARLGDALQQRIMASVESLGRYVEGITSVARSADPANQLSAVMAVLEAVAEAEVRVPAITPELLAVRNGICAYEAGLLESFKEGEEDSRAAGSATGAAAFALEQPSMSNQLYRFQSYVQWAQKQQQQQQQQLAQQQLFSFGGSHPDAAASGGSVTNASALTSAMVLTFAVESARMRELTEEAATHAMAAADRTKDDDAGERSLAFSPLLPSQTTLSGAGFEAFITKRRRRVAGSKGREMSQVEVQAKLALGFHKRANAAVVQLLSKVPDVARMVENDTSSTLIPIPPVPFGSASASFPPCTQLPHDYTFVTAGLPALALHAGKKSQRDAAATMQHLASILPRPAYGSQSGVASTAPSSSSGGSTALVVPGLLLPEENAPALLLHEAAAFFQAATLLFRLRNFVSSTAKIYHYDCLLAGARHPLPALQAAGYFQQLQEGAANNDHDAAASSSSSSAPPSTEKATGGNTAGTLAGAGSGSGGGGGVGGPPHVPHRLRSETSLSSLNVVRRDVVGLHNPLPGQGQQQQQQPAAAASGGAAAIAVAATTEPADASLALTTPRKERPQAALANPVHSLSLFAAGLSIPPAACEPPTASAASIAVDDASSSLPSFQPLWDGACIVADPLLREIAPPLDSIRSGNTFSIDKLPWFPASEYPVVLDLPMPPVGISPFQLAQKQYLLQQQQQQEKAARRAAGSDWGFGREPAVTSSSLPPSGAGLLGHEAAAPTTATTVRPRDGSIASIVSTATGVAPPGGEPSSLPSHAPSGRAASTTFTDNGSDGYDDDEEDDEDDGDEEDEGEDEQQEEEEEGRKAKDAEEEPSARAESANKTEEETPFVDSDASPSSATSASSSSSSSAPPSTAFESLHAARSQAATAKPAAVTITEIKAAPGESSAAGVVRRLRQKSAKAEVAGAPVATSSLGLGAAQSSSSSSSASASAPIPITLAPPTPPSDPLAPLARASHTGRRLAVVLGQSYLVLAELLVSKSAAATTAGGASAASASAAAAAGGDKQSSSSGAASSIYSVTKGRALAVCPLHVSFACIPPLATHVVDIRASSRDPIPLATALPPSTDGLAALSAPPVPSSSYSGPTAGSSGVVVGGSGSVRAGIYGFVLALDDSDVSAHLCMHMDAARRRILGCKIEAISRLKDEPWHWSTPPPAPPAVSSDSSSSSSSSSESANEPTTAVAAPPATVAVAPAEPELPPAHAVAAPAAVASSEALAAVEQVLEQLADAAVEPEQQQQQQQEKKEAEEQAQTKPGVSAPHAEETQEAATLVVPTPLGDTAAAPAPSPETVEATPAATAVEATELPAEAAVSKPEADSAPSAADNATPAEGPVPIEDSAAAVPEPPEASEAAPASTASAGAEEGAAAGAGVSNNTGGKKGGGKGGKKKR